MLDPLSEGSNIPLATLLLPKAMPIWHVGGRYSAAFVVNEATGATKAGAMPIDSCPCKPIYPSTDHEVGDGRLSGTRVTDTKWTELSQPCRVVASLPMTALTPTAENALPEFQSPSSFPAYPALFCSSDASHPCQKATASSRLSSHFCIATPYPS